MTTEHILGDYAAPPAFGDSARIMGAQFLLGRFLRNAEISITFRNNAASLTAGKRNAPFFALEMDSPATLWDIIRHPDPRLGETYMDGAWDLTEGDPGRFMTMLAQNAQALLQGRTGKMFEKIMRPSLSDDAHDLANSRENVRRHYDIGNDLYELMLDEGLNYSCAFFARADMTLREAQLNKIRTTIERLDIRPGMRVLDIGCGWGETAMTVARETGAAQVTGITLSESQLAVARARAARMRENLDDNIKGNAPDFRLEDYRDHARTHPAAYDRIVSIGMFEHVGADCYPEYFAAIRRQLAPGGRALVHSFMNADAVSTGGKLRSVWLQRYIFPGGELPDLREMLEVARAQGLVPAVAPYLQPPFYYAETLRRWRANFLKNLGQLNQSKYDARFRRMWVYYLAMCEAMFEGCGFQVGQVVFRAAD